MLLPLHIHLILLRIKLSSPSHFSTHLFLFALSSASDRHMPFSTLSFRIQVPLIFIFHSSSSSSPSLLSHTSMFLPSLSPFFFFILISPSVLPHLYLYLSIYLYLRWKTSCHILSNSGTTLILRVCQWWAVWSQGGGRYPSMQLCRIPHLIDSPLYRCQHHRERANSSCA